MKSFFPIFKNKSNRPELVYLDSAASSQVPQSVLDRVCEYYRGEHSNVHRGVHFLAESATDVYETCRAKVADFLDASGDSCLIFTSGTTHAVNLAADLIGQDIQPGDLIVVGPLEHHSNFLPWLQIAQKKKAQILFYRMDSNFRIDPQSIPYENPRLKLIALTHVSNVTGGVQPIEEIIRHAKQYGIRTFVDGAQAVAHLPVNLTQNPADFYAFSGHKMHAITGIGVLYVANPSQFEKARPYMSGGGMVADIDLNSANFSALPLPQRFEAGTPNIVGTASLSAAIDFISEYRVNRNHEQTTELTHKIIEKLEQQPEIAVFADKKSNTGIVSFSHAEIHPHDMASLLSTKGVCIRAGHHCAKPLMEAIGEKAVCRLSLACYNDEKDIEAFFKALSETCEFFQS